MRELLKQDTKFQCSEKCESELQDLKKALVKAPVLAPFRNDRKVYIYTQMEVCTVLVHAACK